MKSLSCVLLIENNEIENTIISYIENFKSIEIVDVLRNSVEAIEKLNHDRFDILILNTKVDGLNAIEFLKMIHSPPFIIGLTDQESNIMHLLNSGFTDLLFFKFTMEEFCIKISKIIKILNLIKKVENLTENIVSDVSSVYNKKDNPEVHKRDFIFLRFRKVSTKIKFDDIEYIQNVGNVLKIYDVTGNYCYHTSTLSRMLENLPSDRFIRLNKSIIINYSKIEKVERNIIHMKDQTFKLSRTYAMQMMKILA